MAEIYRIDSDFDHRFFAGSSCAFGVFDGVHCGHQYLIARACDSVAHELGKSIALTFDKDPDEVFRPEALKKLMSNDERMTALARSGVDAVIVLPFTPAFSASSPRKFLKDTFNGCHPRYLHVGNDFRFGAKAAGTVHDLSIWGADCGVSICAHDLKTADGAPITATRIRALLDACNIEEANKLLGHSYSVTGIVEPGRQEGSDMGFRTANMKIASQRQALGEGVYAAYATAGNIRYKAAVSVGVSPVFAARTDATCEAHLLDFTGDLYGEKLKIEFMHYLRPMIAFDTIEELISTVKGNIAWVREHL